MKTPSTLSESSPALGILVTPRKTYGILLRAQSGQAEMMRRFTRVRSHYSPVQAASHVPSGDGADASLDDVGTLHIGEAPVADSLFLSSEFGELGAAAATAGKVTGSGGTSEMFTAELQDLLTECREGVQVEPVLSLVMDAADVQYAEVRIPEVAGEKPEKHRARALALLGELISEFDAERALFLPMTPADDATPRFLAVAPRPDDASTRTLKELRQQHRGAPPARLLDTEVTLLLGLARLVEKRLTAEPTEVVVENGVTLVVRPGSDDTIVLALQNGTLQHYAQLRSLTAFDAPETLCSRILLQQDEHNMGEIGRVLVLSDTGEDALVEYLSRYYPEADVRSCREVLAVEMLSDASNATEVPFVMAYAAALRLVGSAHDRALFPDLNFLPSGLLRRRVALPFTWHTLALGALLFCTVFILTAQYVLQQQDISAQRARLAQVDVVAGANEVQQLQAEIDSLQRVTTGYVRSLAVIDSLLVGSDKWSRALEQVSQVASSVRGIWVENWSDRGTSITVNGNATSRDRIVRFADQIGGEIVSVVFAEIREFPVYTFSIVVPLKIELPEAARYLRDQVVAPDSLLATAPLAAPVP